MLRRTLPRGFSRKSPSAGGLQFLVPRSSQLVAVLVVAVHRLGDVGVDETCQVQPAEDGHADGTGIRPGNYGDSRRDQLPYRRAEREPPDAREDSRANGDQRHAPAEHHQARDHPESEEQDRGHHREFTDVLRVRAWSVQALVGIRETPDGAGHGGMELVVEVTDPGRLVR